ncbi:sulfatase-like hydrolase/transferase [Roseiconus nitratireducens]|uniref:Sulfatase-like hydrolase/transferase n=1 Tax=Roseiconus nitratireducens TaxID=2605748 RepID=A0A5M6CXT4_9BACT|nr:sulfatase-like hydrolase/transferase [Roseiconus nitratireducens]KAA5540027.1 sulfatase-like hydrolase/transferase [Roseiconus nitratireducens]
MKFSPLAVTLRPGLVIALLSLFCVTSIAAESTRPNILWITSEDNGQQLGCYGDSYADTPNLDKLAETSLRYRTCWSNAPVCAPARTTIIAGMYATSTGGQHMRSGVALPDDVQLYPKILRDAGYYCTNHTKTDYNFTRNDVGWHDSSRKASYKNRPTEDTPFFAVFNITVSHESKIRTRPHTLVHDPSEAPLPAYHPDTPEVRHDWAQYYDKVTEMDREVGKVLKELDDAGLRDSTIVFYYGDHGSGMPRSKRQPFDSGLRVPLLVSIPEKFQSLAPEDYQDGGVTDRLVSFVDLAPTALSLAGIEPPAEMQGVAFAGRYEGPKKDYLFGFRGRMDERIDMVRSCTDGRFIYMRHFYPDRPYLKHVDYMFITPTTRVWKQLFDDGKLNEAQAKFWNNKPAEELFDLSQDPDEVNNLANDPAQADRVAKMRSVLAQWMIDTADTGLMTEAEMHARTQDIAPRAYATSEDYPAPKLVRLAFAATDVNGKMTTDSLAKLSGDDDSRVRFWAARGLALRGETQPLVDLMEDENPSVAIAACDGILMADQNDQQPHAIDRLIQLANVETAGHFVAVAALNVLDMRAPMDDALRQRLSELPRQLPKPPARVGKYVGRLLDKMTKDK